MLGDSTTLGTGFPCSTYPGEITLHAHRSLPQHLLGRSLSESLRSAPLKTYYTPQLCSIVQDQPPSDQIRSPYHDSFLPYDFPEY